MNQVALVRIEEKRGKEKPKPNTLFRTLWSLVGWAACGGGSGPLRHLRVLCWINLNDQEWAASHRRRDPQIQHHCRDEVRKHSDLKIGVDDWRCRCLMEITWSGVFFTTKIFFSMNHPTRIERLDVAALSLDSEALAWFQWENGWRRVTTWGSWNPDYWSASDWPRGVNLREISLHQTRELCERVLTNLRGYGVFIAKGCWSKNLQESLLMGWDSISKLRSKWWCPKDWNIWWSSPNRLKTETG